jgi:hypothetical protein
VGVERGLVVEEIDVGEAAALEEAEDAFRAGLKVREPGLAAGGGAEGLGEEGAEGEPADPAGGAAEEGAAGEVMEQFGFGGVHRWEGAGRRETEDGGRETEGRREGERAHALHLSITFSFA